MTSEVYLLGVGTRLESAIVIRNLHRSRFTMLHVKGNEIQRLRNSDVR
jgi:hypothetical protein